MAFLIIEKGSESDPAKPFSLGEGPVIIGRKGLETTIPDIVLYDEYISRHHAEIIFRENGYQLRDLNSTNGTTIDGIKVAPGNYYPLSHDSVIGLGITPSGARVIIRFKESRTESTKRIDPDQLRGTTSSPLGWLRIDEQRGEIRVDGQIVQFAKKEYDLIIFLYRKNGNVCPKDELIDHVWPEVVNKDGVADAAVDQLVRRVRLKIEPNPSQPQRLINRKNFGYRLV